MSIATEQGSLGIPHTAVISSLEGLTAVAAEARLLNSPYLELRRVSCEFHEGVLTLRGDVPRYCLKQIAQNLVSPVNGVVEVANRLTVVPCTGKP